MVAAWVHLAASWFPAIGPASHPALGQTSLTTLTIDSCILGAPILQRSCGAKKRLPSYFRVHPHLTQAPMILSLPISLGGAINIPPNRLVVFVCPYNNPASTDNQGVGWAGVWIGSLQ